MLLYMNTIETPIYTELNEACRKMDKANLHFFGAFARALGEVLFLGHVSDGKRKDRIPKGNEMAKTGPYGTFGKCVLVFRGV